MKPVITKSPVEAAEFIKRGGVVAFPTETVYGLGTNVFDEEAIKKVFEAKRRPADNPLIAHVSSAGDISRLTAEITPCAEKLIEHFFPGPLTVVLEKADAVPSIATAGLDTIGIRMPANEVAHKLLTACGVPLVAPSANLSGRPSPTTWQAVLEDMDSRIDCILQGEPTEIGLESTVVDCTGEVPMLLRLGAVSIEQLRAVVPETVAADDPELIRRSPGLRHKHYSPRAAVILISAADFIEGSSSSAYIGLHERPEGFALTLICTTIDEYARSLFEFFRECDRRGIDKIFCETVDEQGIGAALMDRLRRAEAEG